MSSQTPDVVDLSESFKAYDVRGIVGSTITDDSVRAVGAAFVDVLELAGATMLVGGDMRASSPEFMQAFADGARSRGANVTSLGLISTDMLYHATGVLNAPGVMFTASHNPSSYNGMKMARAGASPISADTGLAEIQQLAQRYLNEGGIPAVENPGEYSDTETLTDYATFLRSLVDLSHIRPLKIVVDAGNGMAGKTTPAVLGDELLEALPIEIDPLYFTLDGTFPNHPANPLEPENLKDVQARVRETGADLGLAFDGDADRCFVVDENGDPVSPSAITAIVAQREIQRAQAEGEQTPVIIHNLITSQAVPELVTASGGRPVRTRVGHSFIKAVMAEENAVFGGEHSAHYYFRDFFNADTGMLAAMHVLAVLGSTERAMSDVAEEFNPYIASGEINSEVADKEAATARVLEAFQTDSADNDLTVDRLDGVTVASQSGGWWFNVRPSNTEPLLRYNGEAQDESVMAEVRDRALAAIRDQ
ncbi:MULTISPECIES: phosphomannomutase/phosphoglucomutase [Auritidibacter]|uniref:Phosphomannomutase/phosphoglucomutase n=1 Tax=Auritidibacter ignavus TaxID=678932 RepID=A0AAJ6AF30_9MICC|nr:MULTISPECIES: phosphomannomutase/phosphoglucomutase [Auritidibacter]PXA75588.1 phosphomannomutase/phosphoglucomutase [Auritidibacter sp. NML100628]PXA79976.1 phosphomannomutase/phosphoglucomutase [Auritidibacter sp. NML120636]WGH89843.1 phosphomannomutase/phosphoglucomutase [Auritidibacter ignavus]WGH92073.1 phosphomannomutase/phosphoglucomutase [Auritidibacter ignavus]WHS27206.1 phosphomannomutase/phosphoglucomutase [Auritidibacter ignavus]